MEPQEVDGDLFPRMANSASWLMVECWLAEFPPGLMAAGWGQGVGSGQMREHEFGAEGVSRRTGV